MLLNHSELMVRFGSSKTYKYASSKPAANSLLTFPRWFCCDSLCCMFYIGLNEASDGYLLELVIFLIICIVILHVLSVLLCQFLSILVSGLGF